MRVATASSAAQTPGDAGAAQMRPAELLGLEERDVMFFASEHIIAVGESDRRGVCQTQQSRARRERAIRRLRGVAEARQGCGRQQCGPS